MDREVLGRRDHGRKFGVGSLHPGHERHCHAAGQIGILSVGLLPAAPAGIAEDVDVRRPGVQAGADPAEMAGLAGQRVQAANLDADRGGHIMNERRIEGGGQPDGLGEVGGGDGSDGSVQGLRPPVVSRHAQPRDRRRHIDQLPDLLVERHPGDQLGGLGAGFRARITMSLPNGQGR